MKEPRPHHPSSEPPRDYNDNVDDNEDSSTSHHKNIHDTTSSNSAVVLDDGTTAAAATAEENDKKEGKSGDEASSSRGGGRGTRGSRLARYLSAGLDRSGRPAAVNFYARPQQRQKWGDAQCLPRVNWGDLFFDLFFVAATYQVTHILGEDPSLLGILFAAGTFLPVMGIWLEKMWYDARYVHDDDVVHRILELALLVILATAVLHIRSVSILSDPSGQVSMFAFALALVLEKVVSALRYAEVYFFGVGHQEGIRGSVRLMILSRFSMVACYVAAAAIAGIAYFGSSSDEEAATSVVHRMVADAAATSVPSSEYDSGGTTIAKAAGHSTTYVPIWLCFVGYLTAVVAMTVQIQCFFPKDGRHKDRYVCRRAYAPVK